MNKMPLNEFKSSIYKCIRRHGGRQDTLNALRDEFGIKRNDARMLLDTEMRYYNALTRLLWVSYCNEGKATR